MMSISTLFRIQKKDIRKQNTENLSTETRAICMNTNVNNVNIIFCVQRKTFESKIQNIFDRIKVYMHKYEH